jgi:nucleoside-diphosphate-sugar epimerase
VRDRTVAVTGSQGFLGSEIIKTLSQSGYEVLGLSHSKINYLDMASLSRDLRGVEILVHAGWAGIAREDRDNVQLQEMNVTISKNLIEACNIAQVRHVIGLGSQAEFGNQHAPFRDDQAASPATQYGLAKCTVLEHLRESGIQFTWARVFSAYGEGDSRDWIFTKAINAIRNQETLTVGSCSQFWSLTHKSDIASGVKWIIEKNILGAVNLSTTEARTLKSYLEELQSLAGQLGIIQYSQDLIPQNDMYTSPGKMYTSGWRPQIPVDVGFMGCLKNSN